VQKNDLLRVIGIVFIAIVFSGAIATGFWFIFDSKNKSDNRGVEYYQQRERELLARIGEYEQRESARIEVERIRAAREADRIRQERERITRTETQLTAIRGFDRRTGDLLQELAKEISILQDYFYSSKREYIDAINNSDSAVEKISP